MTSDDNRERRRFRYKARFLGAGAATYIRGEIIDISDSGVCLEGDISVTVGAQMHLEFELPTGAVEAVGEVRWVDKREVGIRFVRINAPSIKAINEATWGLPKRLSYMSQHATK